jgi:hypothetical protein
MKILTLVAVLLGSALGMSKLAPAALMDIQQEYAVICTANDTAKVGDSTVITPVPTAYIYYLTIPIEIEDKTWRVTLVIPLDPDCGVDTVDLRRLQR